MFSYLFCGMYSICTDLVEKNKGGQQTPIWVTLKIARGNMYAIIPKSRLSQAVWNTQPVCRLHCSDSDFNYIHVLLLIFLVLYFFVF